MQIVTLVLAAAVSYVAAQQTGDPCYSDKICNSETNTLYQCQNGQYQVEKTCGGLTCLAGYCQYTQDLTSGSASCVTLYNYMCDSQHQVLYKCENGVYVQNEVCPELRYCGSFLLTGGCVSVGCPHFLPMPLDYLLRLILFVCS
jgi:hypothetical protein